MKDGFLDSKLAGKRIVVTGGAGAIGTNLVTKLMEIDDVEVVVIDNLTSGIEKGLPLNKKIEFFNADINDDKILNEAFSKPVDVIFHLASHFANQNSIDHPEQDLITNVLGTIKLLEISRKQNINRFVYTNTSCMYSEKVEFSEDSVDFNYHTPYGISKHTAEHYVMFYNDFYALPTTSVRIFNSFGPHEYGGKYRNVIPNFIEASLRGESLKVMGDGLDTRSFTYVDDLVKGLLQVAVHDTAVGQIFNLGNTIETTIIDLALKINKLTNNTTPISFVPKREWDKSTRRKPNISKATNLVGYENTILLEDGLMRTIEWFKNN
jgi:nucleoside-diphosphate-sugar epimerase